MHETDPSENLDETLPRSEPRPDPTDSRPCAPSADEEEDGGATLAPPAPLSHRPPPSDDEVEEATLHRSASVPPPSASGTGKTTGGPPSAAVDSSVELATLGETMAPPPSRPPSMPPPSWQADPPTRPDAQWRPSAPTTASSEFVPGYEILGVLGQGGMGIVYKARHVALDRVVALKMILRGALADRDAVERFRIEAQAVARLRHPNIVQIYEVGEYAGQPYFSLEYLDGGSLHQKLQGAPQAPMEAARILELLARAVHHAHEQHVIHRDLKPANVLLGADGTPKVTDFGLAKRIEDQDQNRTAAEIVLGTPTYMAPEQASGKTRDVGPAADVYALGAILYDLLTGRPPLRGTTVMDTLQLVQTTEPVPPRRLQPKVPPDLQTICLKCLEKDPARRYSSAAALADDLRRFLDGRPIEARAVGAAERTWKWARRRPAEALLALACAAGLIGLVIGLVVFAAQQGQLAKEASGREKLAHDAEQAEKVHSKQLEEKQAEILAAQKVAEAERDRARGNLGEARRAVTELLEVSEKGIPNEPHLEGLRERILVFAQGLAHNLQTQQSDDPDVRWQAAQTTRLVGDMQERLNKLDDAIASYDAAAGLYEALLKEPEPRTAWRQEAAGNYFQLWRPLMARNKGAEAARALDQAEELLTALSREHPDDGAYRRDLALCWNNRGIQSLLDGDSEKGKQSFQEALRQFDLLPKEEQDRPDVQLETAKAEKNLGVLYHRAGHYREAEEQYRQALTRLKPLVLAAPDVPDYQKEFGPVYINLGALLTDEGPDHYAAALAVYDDAINVCAQLGDKFRGVADYRHLLAEAYDGRGKVFVRRGEADKARADLERARDLLESLPDRSEYRVNEAAVLNLLAQVEAPGDPAAALKAREQALALCEALPEGDRDEADARAEFHRAATALIAWYYGKTREATKAERWPDAVADVKALIELRRKRLAAFASSAEAHADEASAAIVGSAGASLVPEILHEQMRGELASTRLAYARLASQAGAAEDAAAALDSLAQPGPDAPRRWVKYPEAAALAARLAGQAGPLRPAFLKRSMALLHRAADEGVVAPPGLLDSDAFAALRDEPEFRQLRTRLAPSEPRP